jgi:hypothetical protein
MTPQRGPDGKFVSGNHVQPDAAALSSGMPSPLAQPVADAIAKFEGAQLSPEALGELARAVHYARPDLRSYEPAEQDAAREQFAQKIGEVRGTLRRFEGLIAPGRESEALAVLPEFVNTAYAVLVTINFQELEKQLINLAHAGNRLSHPPPLRPLDEWMKIATALGWDADEREFVAIDLLRDDSIINAFNTLGFDTSSGRHVDRQALRDSWAPKVEPWRTRFYERLPRIPGGG